MFNFPFMLADGDGGNIWMTIGMLVLVVFVFYFLMIRPQKKREREANEMRDNLRVGDEVTTIGGIVGKIVSLREETFVLETTKDKTHIRFLRAAIRSVDVRAEDSVDPTKQEPEEKPETKGGKNKKKKNKIAPEQPVAPIESETATESFDAPVEAEERTYVPLSEILNTTPSEEVAVNTEIETVESISESTPADTDNV